MKYKIDNFTLVEVVLNHFTLLKLEYGIDDFFRLRLAYLSPFMLGLIFMVLDT